MDAVKRPVNSSFIETKCFTAQVCHQCFSLTHSDKQMKFVVVTHRGLSLLLFPSQFLHVQDEPWHWLVKMPWRFVVSAWV